jgi:hypothetical protein
MSCIRPQRGAGSAALLPRGRVGEPGEDLGRTLQSCGFKRAAAGFGRGPLAIVLDQDPRRALRDQAFVRASLGAWAACSGPRQYRLLRRAPFPLRCLLLSNVFRGLGMETDPER